MEISIGDLLTVENEKYITLEVLTHEGNNYAFVNKVEENEEECTDEYYIFKIMEDGIRIVIESDLMQVLIPKFEKLLKQDIMNLL